MTNERNQDPQAPTQDQPAPKQYATPRPGQPGQGSPDPKKPRIPDQMENEGDDENQISNAERPGYDEDASTKGATGRSSSDKAGRDPATQKPGAGIGGESRKTPGSPGSGNPSGSNPGGRSGK